MRPHRRTPVYSRPNLPRPKPTPARPVCLPERAEAARGTTVHQRRPARGSRCPRRRSRPSPSHSPPFHLRPRTRSVRRLRKARLYPRRCPSPNRRRSSPLISFHPRGRRNCGSASIPRSSARFRSPPQPLPEPCRLPSHSTMELWAMPSPPTCPRLKKSSACKHASRSATGARARPGRAARSLHRKAAGALSRAGLPFLPSAASPRPRPALQSQPPPRA